MHKGKRDDSARFFCHTPHALETDFKFKQGPHYTGKTKMSPKNPDRGKTGNLEILPKHRILYAQFGNSLILKIKDIAKFTVKFSNFFLEILRLPSQLHI